MVEYEGLILEKPVDASDAFNVLRGLSGKTHKVHTGVALALPCVLKGFEGTAGTLLLFCRKISIRRFCLAHIKDVLWFRAVNCTTGFCVRHIVTL